MTAVATLAGGGRAVPAWSLRVAFLLVGAALVATRPLDPATVAAGGLVVLAAAVPWAGVAWAAIAVFGLDQLGDAASVGGWHPYVLLPGLVALHLLASQFAITPVSARFALAALRRPAVRAGVVTAAGEAALAVALWAQAGVHLGWSPAAVIAAAALLALAGLLFLRLLSRRR
ncbi:hypothetical protein [Gryllotalpicola ginsengisoli]|uniref:hypothetical protein n=1 Tax=Gryllotalpicola ginsengisoli TaxID=444608 RepID=UPI0003B4CD98|nr:hypothetical protein [Gryllotalpicola ginsengisoli]